MSKETKAFQAEVKEILDLMVHSLYSKREIFLRELISNSSDSLDRLRFLEASNADLKTSGEEKHIRLEGDKDKKTLKIIDNGLGMSKDDVVKNLGTIAHSGTREFMTKLKEAKDKPEAIGQFGVGFYSCFMVADEVEVLTSKAGEEGATLWISKGDGNYTVEDAVRPEGHGTTITLKLKDLSGEEDSQDFSEEWVLRAIVKRYSDFIEWPIKMQVSREETERDEEGKPIEGKTTTTIEDQILNSRKALWLRSASDIKEDEYKEFYKHLTHDWSDPLETIHYKAEGSQEFASLLYIPSQAPFDYNQRDTKYGLSLYVKRVFILADCEDLSPAWLRFVKGIVDSNDLPLNVSRELLQKDRQIVSIKKAVVGKVIKQLGQMMSKEREKYEKFWKVFGATLKEGLGDHEYKDKLLDLVLFQSTHGEGYSSFKEYIGRMKEGQKHIYFISGESRAQIADSPYMEKVKKKGYEVLLLTDPVDEWVMQYVNQYEEKSILSVTKDGIDMDTDEEKKQTEEFLKDKKEEFKILTDSMQKTLDELVKEVKVTDRLVDSPVCLVSGAYDPSARMERIMQSMGQDMPKSKRILEINPEHPVIRKLKAVPADVQAEWTEILYSQALLNEGSPLTDPQKFGRQIAKLMSEINL